MSGPRAPCRRDGSAGKKEEPLRGVLTIGMALLVAVAGLLQASCSRKGQEHVFLKLYTSANMMGGIEPCG